MSVDLRIPVTQEQKQVIMDAVADDPEGFAAWARQILLEAASQIRAERGKEKQSISAARVSRSADSGDKP